MRLRYHFSRRRRQLAHLTKRLVRQTAAGRAATTAQLHKLKSLADYLVPRIGGRQVRSVLGTGAFLLAAATSVQAQTFAEPVMTPFGIDNILSENGYYNEAVFADMDGDGDLDLLATGYDNEEDITDLYYQENIGTAMAPEYGPVQTNPFGFVGFSNGTTLAAVDLDVDGDLDLIITGRNYDAVTDGEDVFLYYENTGTAQTPAFAAAEDNPFNLTILESEDNFLLPSFGDLDGDGDLDIFAQQYDGRANTYQTNVLYYENISEGNDITFAEPVENAFGLELSIFNAVRELVDLDNDGDLDMVGTTYSYDDEDNYFSNVIYLENTGTPTSPAFGELRLDPFGIAAISFDGLAPITSADVDGDGDNDLFITSETELLYYENLDPTGVDDYVADIPVTLSPNPTGGILEMNSDLRIGSLEVYNATGQRILNQAGNQSRIDLSAQPAGVYTVRFLLEDGKFGTKRVTKF